MNHRVPVFFVVSALAGCSGGGATSTVPCRGIVDILDVGAKLVSPADGATGVSTSVGTVSFTVTVPSLHSGTFTLKTTLNDSTAVSEPYTTDANGAASVPIPTLQPGTAYQATVHANLVTPGSNCPGAA